MYELDSDLSIDPDGSIDLDEVSRKQSVMMVWTGNESGLSAPISFGNIRAQSLPLDRSDTTPSNNTDAVRVSLATAVAFIADLNLRKKTAYPGLRDRPAIDRTICPYHPNSACVALRADVWAIALCDRQKGRALKKCLKPTSRWPESKRLDGVNWLTIASRIILTAGADS